MSKQKKHIQNYEIIETLQEYEKEYSILLAKNVHDKKYYTLKKLSVQEGSQALYDALLNQARILKTVKHQNIVACYRMFKTSTKLYIVYAYEQGNTLDQILELGPKALTFSQKQNIAKQLCLALSELQKNLVVHLNVKPDSIFISKKLNVTLREFMYAMEIPEDAEIDTKRKIPKSEFVAPEVKRGIASAEGDVYSFGKVLEKLDFSKCKKEASGQNNQKRLEQLDNMVRGMTARDRYQRYTISDVYQCLFSKLKKVKRLRSRSESLGGSRITEHSLSSSKTLSRHNKMLEDFILKILQQRNMSLLLVRLFRTVTVLLKFNSQYTVILGVLLLKKSTKMLANLGKYLHYGKNDIQIDINPKELAKFTKAGDYFKLCELIDKEIALQKKQFDEAVQTIFLHNSSLFKDEEFKRQLKEEAVNQTYLAKCARQYLMQMLKKAYYLNEQKEDNLVDLVIVSHIAAESSFEQFFRSNFNYDQILIDQQEFLKRLRGMPRLLLIEIIQRNLQGLKNIMQPQQSKDKGQKEDNLEMAQI